MVSLRRRCFKKLLVERIFTVFVRIETVLRIFDGVGDHIFSRMTEKEVVFKFVDILRYVCVEPLPLTVVERDLLGCFISLKHLTLVVIRRNKICRDTLLIKLKPGSCVHLRLYISVAYALFTWLKVFVVFFSVCACIDIDYHIVLVIF